jgi:hypothetical protein
LYLAQDGAEACLRRGRKGQQQRGEQEQESLHRKKKKAGQMGWPVF